MTRAVATCPPEASVKQVATMMRDMDIGDVLIVADGKLRGIVTDRDLTIHALTNGAKPDNTPIEKYMTANVVTGKPDWSLEKVADEMGKHQIRRLPIVQEDNLLGIVSLGDVALHSPKQKQIAGSLKNISDSPNTRRSSMPVLKFLAIAAPFALAGAVLLLANSNQGRRWAKELQDSNLPERANRAWQDTRRALEASELPDRATRAFEETRHFLQDPRTRRQAQQLAAQAWSQADGLASDVSDYARRMPIPR